MITITLPRPGLRSLPPVAVSLALFCAILVFARPALASLAQIAALALALRFLLIQLHAPQPDRAAALALILSTLMLNTSLSSPDDALWAAPCLMALASAVVRKHGTMLLWYGIALGFSTDAILMAPFYLALLINRRVAFHHWLIVPVAASAIRLSIWAADASLARQMSAAPGVGGIDPALAHYAPNLWQIVEAIPLFGSLPLAGLALAAATGAGAAYIAALSTRTNHGQALLAPALLAPLILSGLLPGMHVHDFLLPDLLALVMALSHRRRSSWHNVALIVTGSVLGLAGHDYQSDILAIIGAVMMIAATVRIAQPLVHPFANDNPLLART